MQMGAVYPQIELPADPGAVRSWVDAVQTFGYQHILAFDHVVGADRAAYPDWSGPYDIDSTFREPLVFFGHLAALTTVELVTGIIIAPQRQTVLLAKQAAEVDLLTGGRFRLGVGLGWNKVEYQSLGQDFTTRGRRLEEQIALLRRLFSERSVTFEGRFDTVPSAGLAPLPHQRPIPIWVGGQTEPAYRRIGRLADGWFPQVPPGEQLDAARAVVAESAAAAGRDPATIGMEGRINYAGDLGEMVEHYHLWRDAGATHLALNTMRAGLQTVDDHVRVLEGLAAAVLR